MFLVPFSATREALFTVEQAEKETSSLERISHGKKPLGLVLFQRRRPWSTVKICIISYLISAIM